MIGIARRGRSKASIIGRCSFAVVVNQGRDVRITFMKKMEHKGRKKTAEQRKTKQQACKQELKKFHVSFLILDRDT